MEDGPRDVPGSGRLPLWRTRPISSFPALFLSLVLTRRRHQGYELAEDEVKIVFDDFARQFSLQDGTAEYVKGGGRHRGGGGGGRHRLANGRGVHAQHSRGKMQFSARPSENMIKKFTPPPTPARPDPAPECGTIWVEFMTEQQIGVKEIKRFLQHCNENSFRAGIMVTQGALSAQARKVINATMMYTQIECFMQDDLLVNITHHELVPTHVLLSKEEKTALLSRYRLKETQLPRIQQKDPVARYLGLKRGQVVKIIRTSETAGRYASYRLCV